MASARIYQKNRSIGIDGEHYHQLQRIAEKHRGSLRLFAHRAIELLVAKDKTGELDDHDVDMDVMITELERSANLLGDLLVAWRAAFPDGQPRSLAGVLGAIDGNAKSLNNDKRLTKLRKVLMAVSGDAGEINKMRLANKLPINKNGASDIIGGLRLRAIADARTRTKSYFVEEV